MIPFPSRTTSLMAVLLLGLTGFLVGCGGGGGHSGPPAPTLTSIAVTPASTNLAVAATSQFKATGTYSDASSKDITASVTWSSAPATVASIGASSGLATALGLGTSTITAALGSVSNTASLTVNLALTSIAVTPAGPTLVVVGDTQQFTATGTYTDNSTASLTTTVTWTSTTPGTASVSNAPGTQGVATGVATGTTSITAAFGSITSNVDPVTVSAEFAYAVDYNGHTVSQYLVGKGGALTPLSTPTVEAGTHPFSIAADPAGRYAYVANYNFGGTSQTGGTVTQFTIGADGSLSPLSTPVATGGGTDSITVDPTGTYVYAASFGTQSVAQFQIGSGGTLAPLTPATVATTQQYSASVTLNPAGTYAYVANLNFNGPPGTATLPGSVSQYTVGPDGVLTPMSNPSVPAGLLPNVVVVHPSGLYAYVGNLQDNTISQYTISATDGSLSPMSPPTVTTGTYPFAIGIDTAGKNAYVTNTNDGTVSQWVIGSDGTLGTAPKSTVAIGTNTVPSYFTIDPSGRYAYVANRGANTISQFTIGADGSLTPMSTPTAPTGSEPTAIIVIAR